MGTSQTNYAFNDFEKTRSCHLDIFRGNKISWLQRTSTEPLLIAGVVFSQAQRPS